MKYQTKIDVMNKLKYSIILVIVGLFSVLSIVSCDDKEDKKIVIEKGTVTDIDGNVYETVKIGNQWWMAQNLEVTHYNDSTPIFKANSPSAWILDSSSYRAYENNGFSPGLLYNWNAVNDSRKIAPKGWHIPTDAEWKELETYIGMSQNDADKTSWRGTDQANKLRKEGFSEWTKFESIWSSNDYGFSALAGCCILYNGDIGQPGLKNTGFWWTRSLNPDNKPWYRYMDYKKSRVFRYYDEKSYGFSVRCVRD
jgi:uncharacterized protein (TIGR02145 family)